MPFPRSDQVLVTLHNRCSRSWWDVLRKLHIARVLARISKVPVQNSNSKISVCPDLATNLLQIRIPTTFNSLLCQKKQKFTLKLLSERSFVRRILVYYPQKVKIEFLLEIFACSKRRFSGNYPSKRGSWLSPCT